MRVALAVLAVLAVSGCAGLQVRPVERSPTPIPVPPLTLSATPVWSTTTTGFPGRPTSVRLLNQRALVVGPQGFQVIDTESGAAESTVTTASDLGHGGRWDESTGQPVLAGEGVIAPYRLDGRLGLTKLFNGHDVALGETTVDAGGALGTADDGTAVVTVASPDDPTRVDDLAGLRMIAFDSRTGDLRWERPALWPVAIVDGLVLAVSTTHHDPTSGPEQASTVSAVDVMTGEPRWSLVDRYAAADVVLAARDLVVVRAVAAGETKPTLVVVSTQTGERVTDLGAPSNAGCATDGNTMIACGTGDGTLSVVTVAGQQVTKVPCADDIEAVATDRLFVGAAGGRHYSVDLTGKRVDRDLPGAPVALTLDQLVVRTDDAVSGYPLSEK